MVAGDVYRELLGTRFVGVVIGYSIDMATRRHFLDEERRRRQEQRQELQRRGRRIRALNEDEEE